MSYNLLTDQQHAFFEVKKQCQSDSQLLMNNENFSNITGNRDRKVCLYCYIVSEPYPLFLFCGQGLKYAGCIHCRRVRHSPNRDFLGMTLNYI